MDSPLWNRSPNVVTNPTILALAEMKPEDMASNELKKLREKFTKEAINDHQMAQNEGKVRNITFTNTTLYARPIFCIEQKSNIGKEQKRICSLVVNVNQKNVHIHNFKLVQLMNL